MASCAIGIVPVAHIVAMNKLLAMVAVPQEHPTSGSLSRLCNATGVPDMADPSGHDGATHYLGAWSSLTDARGAFYLSLRDNLPAPQGGWPWVYNGQTVLTEAEAQAAANAWTVSVTSQSEWDISMIHANFAAVMAAQGLKLIEYPEE
jgi:hypothetical protein